jgi:hypothetical protein
MNLAGTWHKVNEARFFFDKLHEIHEPMSQTNPDEFAYYFSAFLNAAYSVEEFARREVIVQLKKQGGKNMRTKS